MRGRKKVVVGKVSFRGPSVQLSLLDSVGSVGWLQRGLVEGIQGLMLSTVSMFFEGYAISTCTLMFNLPYQMIKGLISNSNID